MKNVSCASASGSLMYTMVATRSDIVGKFMANPGRAHCEAIKSILRYLKGTKGQYLRYGKGSLELKGFCDSDMAGDVDTHKSTSGYVYTLVSGACP